MTVMAQSFDIGCNRCGEWRTVPARTPRAARKHLRGKGWMGYQMGYALADLCPSCAVQWRDERISIIAEHKRARMEKKRATAGAASHA